MMTNENTKLGLSADLQAPGDATEAAKGLGSLADPGVNLQVRATVILNDTSQVLEAGIRLNRGLVGGEMDGYRLCTEAGWKDCHGLGLCTADRQTEGTAVGGQTGGHASRSFQESASKAMSSAYSRTVTRV